jgi:AcrR family transcriptional regulator
MPRTKTISDRRVLTDVLHALVDAGPRDFTLALAAERSGLAASTLLQRYGSKRALVRAAFRQANQQLREQFDAIAARGPSRERLVSSLVDLARAFGQGTSMADQFVMLAEDLRDPDLGEIAAERSAMIRDFIGRMLPNARIEPNVAARLIEAQWHGAVVQAALSGATDIAAEVRRNLRRLVDLIEA